MADPLSLSDVSLALALSGGNALGAYQAGAYEVLHDAGLEPATISGASVGAVNGALIAGNPREVRLERLRAFWQPGESDAATAGPLDTWRRSAAALWAVAAGRPQVFRHRLPFGGIGEPASLFDHAPLGETLAALVDFGRLNDGPMGYVANALDLHDGEDVMLDRRAMRITADHVRASAALLPVFQPVEIDGRMLGDAGLSANLPVDAVLRDPGPRPLLLFAIDLLPLAAPLPTTLGNVAERMQDLSFATQSRRTIATWQSLFDLRQRHGEDVPAITLVHLVYADQGSEVAGKAFDFSPATIRQRWTTGARDMGAALARIASGEIALGAAGLHVHRVQITGGRTGD